MDPPLGVNFTAFPTRLLKICITRPASQQTVPAVSGVSMLQGDPAGGRSAGNRFDRLRQQVFGRPLRELQRKVTGIEARDVEQILDHARHLRVQSLHAGELPPPAAPLVLRDDTQQDVDCQTRSEQEPSQIVRDERKNVLSRPHGLLRLAIKSSVVHRGSDARGQIRGKREDLPPRRSACRRATGA